MVYNSMKLNKALEALTVAIEQQELKAVGRKPIKLRYLKGSKEKMAWANQYGLDGRMWDVLTPIPGYTKDIGYPTFSLQGLKERGLI